MNMKLVQKTLKRGDERGFILILALVTMLAMTVIGLSVVMNMTTDTQLSRNERDAKTAFQLAESGINEAIARLHLSTSSVKYIGEKAADANFRASGWNGGYHATPSAAYPKDFGKGFGGTRESADGLDYIVSISYLDETNKEDFCDSNTTGANSSANAGTLDDSGNKISPNDWDCISDDTEIVMYGRDFRVKPGLTYMKYGKLPVYKVESIGTSNGTSRKVVAYVGASNISIDTNAAINTNKTITWDGGTCASVAAGSCIENQGNDYDIYLGDTLANIIKYADEKHKCKNNTCSAPGDDIPSSAKIDDIVDDWGDPASDSNSTMIYIDNQGGKDVSINGLNGRGILIVTGNIEIAGNVNYEGLIYVLGKLTLSGGGSGDINVRGGMMAKEVVTMHGNNLHVVYDQQTLLDVGKESGTSAMILWKRL